MNMDENQDQAPAVEETEAAEVVAEETAAPESDAAVATEEVVPAFEEAAPSAEADERPEASTIEEARDPAFKVSEGNPYAPKPAGE